MRYIGMHSFYVVKSSSGSISMGIGLLFVVVLIMMFDIMIYLRKRIFANVKKMYYLGNMAMLKKTNQEGTIKTAPDLV